MEGNVFKSYIWFVFRIYKELWHLNNKKTYRLKIEIMIIYSKKIIWEVGNDE